jgi:uncharacterized membrane protein
MFADELAKVINEEIETLKDNLANPALALEVPNTKSVLIVGQINGMRAVLGYFDEVKKKLAETL